MKTTHKYRVYPNAAQKAFLEKQFGCNRFVWNYFIEKHRRDGFWMTYYEMTYHLAEVIKPNNPWLRDVNAKSILRQVKKLSVAISASSRKINPTNPPKFKKKSWTQCCVFPHHTSVDEVSGRLFVTRKMEPMKIVIVNY